MASLLSGGFPLVAIARLTNWAFSANVLIYLVEPRGVRTPDLLNAIQVLPVLKP